MKGQRQKGIDIYSAKTKTVIQCKLKHTGKKDEVIRKSLMENVHTDLKKAFDLQFEISRFFFVSTFRDDSNLQEFTAKVMDDAKLPFPIYYWGWDTLSKYAEQSDKILKKYFERFMAKPEKLPKKAAPELPDGALGKDLHKKNDVTYLSRRYGDWKQIQFDTDGRGEKFNWPSHNKTLYESRAAFYLSSLFVPV